MSRPFTPRFSGSSHSFARVNGKIRAREVRLIGPDSEMLGVFPISEAIQMARVKGVDLVEIAANANPPVCRLVDYGKYRYEQSKKDKESRKHHHADKLKEIQLSATIDPHDLKVKLDHAIDFLCEEMKVKLALRFRGREMMHQEVGKEVVNKFILALAPYGHPDFPPKVIGRGLNVMLSPLPRAKRAKNPNAPADGQRPEPREGETPAQTEARHSHAKSVIRVDTDAASTNGKAGKSAAGADSFSNNPFAALEVKVGDA